MLEIIQWFDDEDRLIGLIIVMSVFFWGVTSVIKAVRGGDE